MTQSDPEALFWTTIAHYDPDTWERKPGPPGERGGLQIQAPRPADWTLARELAGEWDPRPEEV